MRFCDILNTWKTKLLTWFLWFGSARLVFSQRSLSKENKNNPLTTIKF